MSLLLKKWLQLSQKQRNLIHFAGRAIFIAIAGINLMGLVAIWFPAAIHRALHFPRALPIDYRDYYKALQHLQSGAPLYYAPDDLGGGYLYPPPFLAVLYPLGQFDESTFVRLLFSLLSCRVFCLCLVFGTPRLPAHKMASCVAGLFCFNPVSGADTGDVQWQFPTCLNGLVGRGLCLQWAGDSAVFGGDCESADGFAARCRLLR